MKIPSVIVTYCPRCKKHTEHEVSIYKKGKERSMSYGARYHEEVKHGYGGQKYPELKRTAKTTKKVTLKLKCKECGYTIMKEGIRLRKAEIVEQIKKG
ncbi:MAG: 50S ribosomal protein L44e [Nitrososphaeria archaeon]|jgi:large subunit ribosomal protein L44e